MIQKLTPTYLFERHTPQQVTYWAVQLRYFYFIRAWGGHANDGDEFKAGIKYLDKVDLKNKLSQIGITIGEITAEDEQPELGKSYYGSDFSKLKTSISHFPDLEQPGKVEIAGISVFMWITWQIIEISVSGQLDGNSYEVSQTDFDACLKLEKIFDRQEWQLFKDESTTQSVQCISKNIYPELFI
jgi:hypothetical protein